MPDYHVRGKKIRPLVEVQTITDKLEYIEIDIVRAT
jgi:hypothetical protein